MPTPWLKRSSMSVARIPRLWMVDPRYDNVEVYHSTEFGFAVLKGHFGGQ